MTPLPLLGIAALALSIGALCAGVAYVLLGLIDFFTSVPSGGDVYVLSHVIHDWNENQCLAILGTCRRAMNTGSRLLIVETVLPAGNAPHPGKLLDIAMAIGGSPRLLLLDEPTSGISVEDKFAIMDVVMSALRSRKITILFVEHDMQIVARFADRVLAFYDGTVIADGPPAVALADPQVQAFISGTNAGLRGGAVHA